MEVIPAIDLKDGEVVQLVGGDTDKSESFGDPLKIAEQWVEEGANRLHIIDLDGAINGVMKNKQFIEKIINQTNLKIQVGGGIRSKETATNLLNLGADRIILGTVVFKEPNLINQIKEDSNGEVFVSIDSEKGHIMVEGWKKNSGMSLEEGIKKFEDYNIDGFLLTDIKKEGRRKGIDLEVFELAINKSTHPVIASGGISSIEDLKKLEKVGASGAVVGSALYKKNFKLKEAINSLEEI